MFGAFDKAVPCEERQVLGLHSEGAILRSGRLSGAALSVPARATSLHPFVDDRLAGRFRWSKSLRKEFQSTSLRRIRRAGDVQGEMILNDIAAEFERVGLCPLNIIESGSLVT
mgnify:CR=1 FL=1